MAKRPRLKGYVLPSFSSLSLTLDPNLKPCQHLAEVLTHLRSAPVPRPNPNRPLLTSSGIAPHHLPLEPAAYLATAVDSVAPLLRLTSLAGAAGGGIALQIPKPLLQRQRRRQAIAWMLEASEKRKGGLGSFSKRFADEVVAVVEGKSAAWEKRAAIHRMAVTNRNNLNHRAYKGR